MTNLYFIQGADGAGLNVEGFNSAPGTPIITWPWQGGAANELWAINDDGSIVSGLGSSLYLAPAPTGNGLIISNQPYYWTFSLDGPIANEAGAVVTEGTGQGAPVTLCPPQTGAATQSWWAAPNVPAIPKNFSAWRYITSILTDPDATTFVLNVKGNVDAPGTNIIVWQLQPNSRNSLWQVTSDGRILSALDRSLLVGPSSSSSGGALVTQSATTAQGGQHWSFEPSGLIKNIDTGLYLGIDGNPSALWPGVGPNAVAIALEGSPPQSLLWQLAPSNPLDAIVMQTPVAFPSFVGEEATAYDYITSKLGNIRAQYTNLTVVLSTLKEELAKLGLTKPSGVDWTSWEAVVNQLDAEIDAAESVRAFFEQVQSYQTQFNGLATDRGTQLGTLAGLEQGSSTSIGGLMLSIFEGIAYTALEAMPGAGPVLGNLMEMAVNIATTASTVDSTISPDPFEVAYADLFGKIASAFDATSEASSLMQMVLLSDWGKISAFYTGAKTTGPNSLSWPADQTDNLIDNSMPGFEVSVLQMLLPAKFQIYSYEDSNGDAIGFIANEAQWVTQINPTTWMKYWIADQENWKSCPDVDMLKDYVWGNDVTPADFFQSKNGWGFMMAGWNAVYVPNFDIGVTSSNLVITISNQTPNVLTLSINVSEGDDIGYIGSSSNTLPPYGSAAHLSLYDSGLVVAVTVSDPAGDQVASFTIHMHMSGLKAGDVWPDENMTSSGGYSLSTPICNQGSVGDGYTGVAQITIYYSDS